MGKSGKVSMGKSEKVSMGKAGKVSICKAGTVIVTEFCVTNTCMGGAKIIIKTCTISI